MRWKYIERIHNMERDILRIENRLDKLEKFKHQSECVHPIEKREIVHNYILEPWEEKCTVCGKVFKRYSTQNEALKAENDLLIERIKINGQKLEREKEESKTN